MTLALIFGGYWLFSTVMCLWLLCRESGRVTYGEVINSALLGFVAWMFIFADSDICNKTAFSCKRDEP